MRRVVAGPGQTVAFVDGVLLLDGQLVAREQVGSTQTEDIFGPRPVGIFRETLPNGRQYLTQDFGPGGDVDDIPPILVPPDHWFTVGDNRDNAIDARIDGPTPTSDLCGIVYTVLTSQNAERIGKRP